MSFKIKKIAFFISIALSIVIIIARCDRGVPTPTEPVTSYYDIGGLVTNNGLPVSMVEIKLDGDKSASTYTDSVGSYSFSEIAEGLYAVYPVSEEYSFSPSKREVELKNGDLLTQNFSMEKQRPNLRLPASSLDFGQVYTGQTKRMYLEIGNLGEADLEITRIASSNSVFTVSRSTLTVKPDTTGYLAVVFAPQDSNASHTGELTFRTDDPNKLSVTVTLTGSGVVFAPPEGAHLALSPDSLNFGTVFLGQTGTRPLVLRNDGTSPLSITSITPSRSVFTTDVDTASLNAGDSVVVNVTFTPRDTATVGATLRILNTSGNLPSLSYIVTGSGREQEPVPPTVSISSEQVNFGTIFIDSTGYGMLIIRNTGTDSLHLTSLEIDNGKFSIPLTMATLAPWEALTLTISFKASQRGTYEGKLSIYSDDPKNNPVAVALRARVEPTPPNRLEIHPSMVSFDSVNVGFDKQSSFWIVNPTGNTLIVRSIRSTRTPDFTIGVSSLEVGAHDSAEVWVTFAPLNVALYSEFAVLRTNVPGSDSLNIVLVGVGLAAPVPGMRLDRSSVDFGTIVLGSRVLEKLVLENKGPGALKVYSIESDNSFFKVNDFTGILKAGQSRFIDLVFEPHAVGVISGKMVITSNDPEQRKLEIPLEGAVIDTTGAAAVMTLSTRTLDIGTAILTTRRIETFIIGNIGKDTLRISEIRTTNEYYFGVEPVGMVIEPGMSRIVEVSFSPSSISNYMSLILIASNDQVRPVDTIRVTGEGISSGGVVGDNEVFIPGGSFLMGSGSTTETERLTIVSSFYMDAYEVTNAEYKEFIDAGGYDNLSYWTAEGWQWKITSTAEGFRPADPRPRYWGYDNEQEPWVDDPYSNRANSPVVGINWFEAYAYAKFRGKDLPTEAQWEYAARGDSSSIYPWGDKWFGSYLNHGTSGSPYYDGTDGYSYTAPVGSFPDGATEKSIYDLAGNICEWCRDWKAPYDASDDINPNGPFSGTERILRGGSWIGSTSFCRAFHRNHSSPHKRYKDAGIRLVRNY